MYTYSSVNCSVNELIIDNYSIVENQSPSYNLIKGVYLVRVSHFSHHPILYLIENL